MNCEWKHSLLKRNVLFSLLLAVILLAVVAEGSQHGKPAETPASNNFLQSLTVKERTWLRDHPVISVVQDPDWPPVEFTDERGEPSGMAGDYLSLVEQRLGTKFERVRNLSWQEAYARLKRREIDMTTSVAVTPEREQFWAFTKPYMRIPIVIVAHADVTYIADMRELAGKKVAVVDGYAVNDWIPRDFPDIQLVRVKTAQDGLKTLQKGEVFAYVENMLVVGYHMAKLKMTTLKIAGETPYVNAQCMAVRKDWPTLAGILQKALDSISETERNDIYKKWLPIRYEHRFDYSMFWQVLVIFAVILLALVIWIQRLSREIRNRKKAEAALNDSEVKFRLVFEAANVGKSITLPTGEIDVNKAFSDMLGYSRKELKDKRWQELTPPEEVDSIQKLLDPLLRGEKDSVRFNKRYIHKNGSCIWADASVVIHRDLERKPLFFITTLIDITERYRAEEALLRSEENFRQFLENSPLGVRIVSAEGETIYANHAILEIYGYDSIDELKATPVTKRYTEESIAKFQKRREKRKGGDYLPSEYEISIVRKDGEVRHLQVFRKEILWDGKKQYQVIYQDITESTQAKEAQRKSEEFFRHIFEQAAVGMSILSASGVWLQVNQRLCDILGYSREGLMQIDYRDITHPDHLEQDIERVRQMLEGIRNADSWEKRYIRRDGRVIWVRITTVLSRTEDNQPKYFITVTEDITASKQVEEEKHNLEERLQRSEKMEALGTLAGGVAHDLNNVLGIVVGYAEMLLEDVDKSSPLRRGLENIMSGGQKAAAIVDDLLTLARRGVPGRKVLNLNRIIADSQKSPEFANLSFHHPEVKVKAELDPDLLNISGSPVHLGKTLYNLVANACEAMTKGGLVTIKTINQYLDKPIQGYDQIRAGDYVVLSVSDTGEGIHEADLKRIFEPFYTKKAMGRSGTGLGLAVVWGTVKDHHGYINVQSESGKGSTFTLYFPVTREEITTQRIAVPISEYMGQGESILMVDDVKEQRDLAAGMLGALNYKVSSVSSGEDAVAYMREHDVDLIVLDMIMDPGMDGLETYRNILEFHPQQKAIIVSGFSESDRVHTAIDLGAGAYVRKPYIKEKLGLAVRRELDRK